MLLGFPKKFLKAFTVFRISAAVAPDASNTCGAAEAATGLKMSVKPSMAIASESECLFIIFMDCIGLIKIEVELLLLLADEIAAYGPKQARPRTCSGESRGDRFRRARDREKCNRT